MKCWQCGYDLRMHDGSKCPECGSSKVPPPTPLRDDPLVFGWAIIAAMTLQVCAVAIGGAGQGSYLPLMIVFAPVALPWLGIAFFAGLPLYIGYAAALTSVRRPERRRWALLGVCGVHYASLMLMAVVRPIEFQAEWSHLLDVRSEMRGPIAVAAIVYIATHVGLAVWAFQPQRIGTGPMTL